MLNPFSDSNYYTGPPCSIELIASAEARLGFKLPASYLDALSIKNGGRLTNSCMRTNVPTEWAPDHIEVHGIFGIGDYRWGIDSELGSKYLIKEWGFPKVGIVIASTPSFGNDCIMLDYRACGKKGEPQVIYVFENRSTMAIAANFADFITRLENCEQFSPD